MAKLFAPMIANGPKALIKNGCATGTGIGIDKRGRVLEKIIRDSLPKTGARADTPLPIPVDERIGDYAYAEGHR